MREEILQELRNAYEEQRRRNGETERERQTQAIASCPGVRPERGGVVQHAFFGLVDKLLHSQLSGIQLRDSLRP